MIPFVGSAGAAAGALLLRMGIEMMMNLAMTKTVVEIQETGLGGGKRNDVSVRPAKNITSRQRPTYFDMKNADPARLVTPEAAAGMCVKDCAPVQGPP